MKKSIRLIFFFNSLLFYTQTFSQLCDTFPYRYIYYNKGFQQTQAKNLSFTSNNDIILTGTVNISLDHSNNDAWIMRTTSHGTPLWSKAIGTSADEEVNTIRGTKDGGFVFAGATKYNAHYDVCWVTKVDANQNPQWSLALYGTNGKINQITELESGGYVAVGTLYLDFKGDGNGNVTDLNNTSNFIVRLDADGKLLWQHSFYHYSKEQLNKVQQISDGNFITTGNVLDTSIAYILKINQSNGNIIWMNQYPNPQNFNFAHIDENNDGSLSFKTGNYTYNFTPQGIFKQGSSQIVLSSNDKKVDNGQIIDVGAVGPNEIYYANIKGKPVLFNTANGATVNWAYNFISDVSSVSTLGNARIYKNNIYMLGGYTGNHISDTSTNEPLAYLLRATINGKAFCSENANVSFKIANLAIGSNVNYTFTDKGSVTPSFINVYSKNIEPVRMQDCAEQTCCNDTVISNHAEICNNNTYKLPDGNVATQPGFYTARFNTIKGCDSIMYSILSAEKNIDLGLTKDTCLINNTPVTFYLPNDSSLKYQWQNGITTNQFTATMPGTYWVTAISSCNAIIDSVDVHDNCLPDVFIPSAFTPNNDGLNDVFRIPEINGQHLLDLNIYNRYGQLIFHTANATEGWDGAINGKPQLPGTYVYIIRYSDLAGKLHLIKGTVSLIR